MSVELAPPAAPATQNGKADPKTAAKQLEAIWKLAEVHVTIAGARITGHGRDASCEVYLSNAETMVFERLADIATGTALMAELASCAGVAVNPNPLARAQSIALIGALAERQASETADSMAREWGIEFLASCPQVEVDIADQAQRWAIFERLREIDPWAMAKESGGSFARHMMVPIDESGVRYVRVGWYQAYVRQFDGTVSANQIVGRMLRVGWERRGKEGRIGARRPKLPGFMNIKFLLVPAGWEDIEEAEGSIPADTRSVREDAEASRARDVSTNSGYQPNGHADHEHVAAAFLDVAGGDE